jgi:hypothetical protein
MLPILAVLNRAVRTNRRQTLIRVNDSAPVNEDTGCTAYRSTLITLTLDATFDLHSKRIFGSQSIHLVSGGIDVPDLRLTIIVSLITFSLSEHIDVLCLKCNCKLR